MKTKKFTVIDGVIVLGILAAVFILFSMIPKTIGTSATSKVTVKVLATEVDPKIKDNITKGETAVLSFTEEYLGTVVDFSAEPSKKAVADLNNNQFKLSASDLKDDVYITLEVDAVVSDSAIKVGDVYLRAGSPLPVLGKNFVVNSHIIEVLEQ